jgi:Mn2+/Fe2+ NRAMP family transporter
MVHIPWEQVMKAVVMPRISREKEYITTVVAVLGTTISPYLFFWQASEEVEQLRGEFGWLATTLMSLAVIFMLYTFVS